MGAVLLALGLVVLGSTPLGPEPASAPAGEFFAASAMRDIEQIARAPHRSASAQHAALRECLGRRLETMGVVVRMQERVFPDSMRYWFNRHDGTKADAIPLVNVIGVLPAREPDPPAVALMAHYDSVPGSPGSADGAGVASIRSRTASRSTAKRVRRE